MAVPLLGAPAQRCGVAKQEQVEEDHQVQLEEVGEDEAVGGSSFVCLRLLPSLSQREESRVMKREWDLVMLRRCDCEGGPQVFCPSVRSGNVGAVDNTSG